VEQVRQCAINVLGYKILNHWNDWKIELTMEWILIWACTYVRISENRLLGSKMYKLKKQNCFKKIIMQINVKPHQINIKRHICNGGYWVAGIYCVKTRNSHMMKLEWHSSNRKHLPWRWQNKLIVFWKIIVTILSRKIVDILQWIEIFTHWFIQKFLKRTPAIIIAINL